MPAQQGVGPNEERFQPRPRQDTEKSGEDPIGMIETGRAGLEAENSELVAQNEDLGVFGLDGPNRRTSRSRLYRTVR
jgi:hypothetical protein